MRKISKISLVVAMMLCACGSSYAEEVTIELKSKSEKERDEVPVVIYDDEKEKLEVFFIADEGHATITITNMIDGEAKQCSVPTSQAIVIDCPLQQDGVYVINITTAIGLEYDGYLSL